MAEFQKVMKQWRRMCEKNQTDCMRLCPICANPTCGELTEATDEDIRKAEDAIMAWAAEHPEPVYPTWGEWFVSKGMLPEKWDDLTSAYVYVVPNLIHSLIPADIAQKLGVEPKEVRDDAPGE